ncbi:MAG: S1 RNA-binding domain-containing protein [Chloroflexota bacterium]|nr:MAG: 30S ribosomal protein S1 [Chloroflexota bacterium]
MNSKMPGLDHTDEQEQQPVSSDAVEQPEATTETDTAATNAQGSESETALTETPAAEAEQSAAEAQETASAAPAEAPQPEAQAAEEPAEEAGPRLKRGDVIEGTITSTSPTAVTVDVGVEATGIIPSNELEKMTKATLESLKVGERIAVYVVNPRDHQGNVVLSVNRALEELDWRQAEEYRQTQQVYETKVAGYNKGGLIVRFGRVRGFVPQSQMSADRRRLLSGETPEERWGRMVNEPIAVKVMEVDRARNRLILSERSAARESREKRKEALINQLTKGEVRIGRVVSLEDFGAFVDVGGAEGLVHLTELSWKHVTHPRELLEVGQEVKVEVISVDREQKRIGLSIKSQEPDPWDTVAINYNVGQLVQGIVTKLTKFGAFARLVDVPEIEGLIHISELSEKRVNHPREVVQEGDKLTLRVVKMDIANRRLGLSLKKVNSPEYLDQDWLMFGGSESPAQAATPPETAAPTATPEPEEPPQATTEPERDTDEDGGASE